MIILLYRLMMPKISNFAWNFSISWHEVSILKVMTRTLSSFSLFKENLWTFQLVKIRISTFAFKMETIFTAAAKTNYYLKLCKIKFFLSAPPPQNHFLSSYPLWKKLKNLKDDNDKKSQKNFVFVFVPNSLSFGVTFTDFVHVNFQ